MCSNDCIVYINIARAALVACLCACVLRLMVIFDTEVAT